MLGKLGFLCSFCYFFLSIKALTLYSIYLHRLLISYMPYRPSRERSLELTLYLLLLIYPPLLSRLLGLTSLLFLLNYWLGILISLLFLLTGLGIYLGVSLFTSFSR